ncbi:conserved hypothetical protein [Burkholderia ambifaria IOP40-10]|uniref:Uncharacterized protein n=1 Tax=Burkholderia ambifaria IOP40-10 TaxID=396596 RepID=B1FR05_9BURK|nr:hypothetical protein [Burkholderia ambifaria]EDT00020.1 conserved hypothetical protein [Burkholderia ambifaria IOP40-10]
MAIPVLGIAWYRECEYERCKTLLLDADTLPDRWSQWKEQAEAIRNDLIKDGFVVIPVHINPDTFASWCSANGFQPDQSGRMAFASAEACRTMVEQYTDRSAGAGHTSSGKS